MSQYNKDAEGYFTVATAAASQFISLPFMPNTFEIWNKTQWGSTSATPQVQYAIGFAEDPAGYGYATENVTSSTALKNVAFTSGAFSFVSAGTYQYGPTLTISGIVAATGVVTTTSAHGLSVGDAVLIYGTTAMLQIAGTLTTVTAVGSPTTFTIGNIPTSGFAAGASAGFVKRLFYADLYVPFGTNITGVGATVTGVPATQTVINTSLNHKFVVGQEVFFVFPQTGFVNTTSVWGMQQLDSQYVLNTTGVPQQAYITQTAATNSNLAANQFAVNINSTGFATFTYPTSAQASLGITFPQVLAIGDQNSGGTLVPPISFVPPAITIPGAFYANTRQGVLIGASLLLNASDVIRWRATYPDLIKSSAP